MIFMILTSVGILSGCASPKFVGAAVMEIEVSDSLFRVYMQRGGSEVEAHRISVEPRPSLVLTLEKAYRAIELVTGCGIVAGSLQGDQAIILAEVDCVMP